MWRNRHTDQGFTLVEMMAALVVALLVLGIVFAIRQFSQSTERAVFYQSGLQEQARQIEQFLTPVIRDSTSILSSGTAPKIYSLEQTRSDPITLATVTWDPASNQVTIQKQDPAWQLTFKNIVRFELVQNPPFVTVNLEFQNGLQSFQYSFSAVPRL